MLTFDERCKLARQAKAGDVWVNIKTGRTAEILARVGLYGLRIKHESGRETSKQDHYFAGEFIPQEPRHDR